MKSSRFSRLVTAYAALFTVAGGLLVLDSADRKAEAVAFQTLRIEPVTPKKPVLVAALQPKAGARLGE